ncbi:MAG TPA: hypothetical protein PLO67_15825, partial [Saprospiraceae bacterium]|nr:hypothetical protein [Saprospiraceae bacterium]
MFPFPSFAVYVTVCGVGGQVIGITVPESGPPVCVMVTKVAHSSVATGIGQFNLPLHWSGSLPII